MNNTVHIANALPGAGKTQYFIDGVKRKDKVLLAAPTIKLSTDISDRLVSSGINTKVLNSESITIGPVKENIESSLQEIDYGCVVIITHTALLSIDPTKIQGWCVVIDEVPNINNCQSATIGFSTFGDLFDSRVQVHDDGRVTMMEGMEHEIRERYPQALRAKIHPSVVMFGGLIDPTAEINLEKKDKEYVIMKSAYHDFSKIIEHSKELHVLGNAIERSLFYRLVIARGFLIEESRYQPDSKRYTMAPTIMPLFSGERISKTILLTRTDGTRSDTFDDSCIGWSVLKSALDSLNGRPALVQIYDWAKAFPFDEYSNVEITPFDARGLNGYSSHSTTVNFIHGNPDPIQGRMNRRMLELMEVDVVEGEKCIRYERYIEAMVQHIARTDIRNYELQESPTTHIVPCEGAAFEIQEALKIACHIDTSLMVPTPQSASSLSRLERKRKAQEMLKHGYSVAETASILGVTRQTIYNWMKQKSLALAA